MSLAILESVVNFNFRSEIYSRDRHNNNNDNDHNNNIDNDNNK